jgi:hypothetical protein
MIQSSQNKYRCAIEVLQRGRDALVDSMADEILDQGDDLLDAGFRLNEMLETQGTRLHFLGLLIGQLEQSAEALDEALAPPPAPKRRAPRKTKTKTTVDQQTRKEQSADDVRDAGGSA